MKIDIHRSYTEVGGSDDALRQLIQWVCERSNAGEAAVSVTVLDDTAMQRLNRKYKDLDQTTDCFSFNLSDSADACHYEILVNGELAVREARARCHAEEAELALYVTHGLLHQLGFDDTTPEAAAKMHAREDEILQHFGYGAVYNRPEQDRQA